MAGAKRTIYKIITLYYIAHISLKEIIAGTMMHEKIKTLEMLSLFVRNLFFTILYHGLDSRANTLLDFGTQI